MIHRISWDLTYVHGDCVPCVFHWDTKPSNILLDNNLNGHLFEFGIARILGTSKTLATTDVVGTISHVATDYEMTCPI